MLIRGRNSLSACQNIQTSTRNFLCLSKDLDVDQRKIHKQTLLDVRTVQYLAGWRTASLGTEQRPFLGSGRRSLYRKVVPSVSVCLISVTQK